MKVFLLQQLFEVRVESVSAKQVLTITICLLLKQLRNLEHRSCATRHLLDYTANVQVRHSMETKNCHQTPKQVR